MRKIEKQMIEAIRSGDNWKSANTEVVITDDTANVYLHGHHIATASRSTWGKFNSWDRLTNVKANEDTFRAWPTATTRSRLRALGIDASIKNFQACIDGMTL
tara:strand:- start:498 stop:803 length:306 start_codon:yes stop_codon:yes gene_type:complete